LFIYLFILSNILLGCYTEHILVALLCLLKTFWVESFAFHSHMYLLELIWKYSCVLFAKERVPYVTLNWKEKSVKRIDRWNNIWKREIDYWIMCFELKKRRKEKWIIHSGICFTFNFNYVYICSISWFNLLLCLVYFGFIHFILDTCTRFYFECLLYFLPYFSCLSSLIIPWVYHLIFHLMLSWLKFELFLFL